VIGTYLLLRCRACGHEFDAYQPTIAGLAVGEHICPGCSATWIVAPEDFEAAVAHHLPSRSLEEMEKLTEEATWVAETWHRPETLARLLTYRGVGLGPATERELLAFITFGLAATCGDAKGRG